MADLNLDAIQAEASGDPHGPYPFGGEDYFIPRTADWPAEALQLIVAGDVRGGLRMAMGDDTFDRFDENHPKMAVYEAIFEDIAAAENLGDSGNSSRSSSSSRSTPARSKRTSPATTGSR